MKTLQVATTNELIALLKVLNVIRKESNYTKHFNVAENGLEDSPNRYVITLEGFNDNDMFALGAKYQMELTAPSKNEEKSFVLPLTQKEIEILKTDLCNEVNKIVERLIFHLNNNDKLGIYISSKSIEERNVIFNKICSL